MAGGEPQITQIAQTGNGTPRRRRASLRARESKRRKGEESGEWPEGNRRLRRLHRLGTARPAGERVEIRQSKVEGEGPLLCGAGTANPAGALSGDRFGDA